MKKAIKVICMAAILLSFNHIFTTPPRNNKKAEYKRSVRPKEKKISMFARFITWIKSFFVNNNKKRRNRKNYSSPRCKCKMCTKLHRENPKSNQLTLHEKWMIDSQLMNKSWRNRHRKK